MFNISEYLFTESKNNDYRLRLENHLKTIQSVKKFKSSFFATGTGGHMQTYIVPKVDIIHNFNLSFLWLKDSDQKFEDLDSAFHIEWFQENSFNIPEMILNIEHNLIEISQGRHRTLILLRFLDEIPIAIESNKVPIQHIPVHWKKIQNHDLIILPDLPKKNY